MLKPNEKFYIKSVWCDSTEDDYNNGEVGGICSSWNDRDLQINKTIQYASAEDAIKAVCKANCFDFKKENWENFGIECCEPSEYSRFDTTVMVDAENSEATPDQVSEWKLGKIKLYACHVSVELEIRTDSRQLTEDEAKSW